MVGGGQEDAELRPVQTPGVGGVDLRAADVLGGVHWKNPRRSWRYASRVRSLQRARNDAGKLRLVEPRIVERRLHRRVVWGSEMRFAS